MYDLFTNCSQTYPSLGLTAMAYGLKMLGMPESSVRLYRPSSVAREMVPLAGSDQNNTL